MHRMHPLLYRHSNRKDRRAKLQSKAKVIAVTGGIACGKSTVAKILEQLGCRILDTDEVAHRLESVTGVATPKIVSVFGEAMLASDGSIDRRKLGAEVFAKPAALQRLNAIIHPLIAAETAQWIAAAEAGTLSVVLVPLLYESKFECFFSWDAVIAVVCKEDEQIRRIQARGFREEEAKVRIAAQIPNEEKVARADYVIRNDGTLAILEDEVKRVIDAIRAS